MQINEYWAMDFISYSLHCGKRFKTLNIIDESTRECLAIEVDFSLPAERVIRVLSRLKEERGLPEYIRENRSRTDLLNALMVHSAVNF